MAPVHLPRPAKQGRSWRYKYGACSTCSLLGRIMDCACFKAVKPYTKPIGTDCGIASLETSQSQHACGPGPRYHVTPEDI